MAPIQRELAALACWLPVLAHCVGSDCDAGAACVVEESDVGALLQHGRPGSLLQQPSSMLVSTVGRSESATLAVQQGLQLASQMQAMATHLPDGPTKSLLHSFMICGSCSSFKRVGETHDGGYLACMDGFHDSIKAVYSMGVEQHDQFSLDVYNLLNVSIHQFDCTVNVPAQTCPKCHFYKSCLSAPDGSGGLPGHQNWPLQQALAESGQKDAANRTLLMKMDIEGGEWPILAADGAIDFLKKFDQLVFEFHNLKMVQNHPQYLRAMQNLAAAGFKVAHVHGNNWAGQYIVEKYSIPDVIEVTYISHGEQLATCSTPTYSPLDAPNTPNRPELPEMHLP